MKEEDVPVVMSLVSHFFPPGDIEEEFITGSPVQVTEEDQVGFYSIPASSNFCRLLITFAISLDPDLD